MAKNDKKTPMQQQWEEMKAQHPGIILFFRMGDFYEMFGEDAVRSAKILGLTVTTRDRNKENSMPMAGIPHHALDRYLKEMIKAGESVAICDQLEDPAAAKGIVKRGVTRVVTPGTIFEESCLSGSNNNFLAAVCVEKSSAGLAWCDVSTGEFQVCELPLPVLLDELERLAPAETLIPKEQTQPGKALAEIAASRLAGTVTKRDGYEFTVGEGKMRLGAHFGVDTLAGFGLEGNEAAIGAAGAILVYLDETQKTALRHVRNLSRVFREDYLILDRTTQRNLELTQPLLTGNKNNTLVSVLDRTKTGPGSRLLKNWLLRPLMRICEIKERQQAVGELMQNHLAREELRELLGSVWDMERIMGRVTTSRANARDLNALAKSCRILPGVATLGKTFDSGLLQELAAGIDTLVDLADGIESALMENPPVQIKEGGMIRSEYNEQLAQFREVCTGGKDWIKSFQQAEQERSGISTLKIGFNRVFGYYIEVTNTHKDKVPTDYERKQTLANAERYITPELKEREQLVLGAEDKIIALEYELFVQLREAVAAQVERVQMVAASLAALDCLASMAELAATRNYCLPEIHEGIDTSIVAARHPVLDISLSEFTPNDTEFTEASSLVHIITGPNMAGKSTYIRQVALIAIMAQMGGGVPAESASIGLYDRIFTRVGAADDLGRGQSTFMVEMSETANIINNATARSLVILDEVGRGTSTFDGVSLAWAITEYLVKEVGARTLFATHYHELAELGVIMDRAKNFNVAVRDWAGEVIFLHRIQEGATDRSYGIHVAKIAGLPPQILDRAKELLAGLEAQAVDRDSSIINENQALRAAAREVQMDLFSPQAAANDKLVEDLASLELDHLTPVQAHQKLQDFVEYARQRMGYN